MPEPQRRLMTEPHDGHPVTEVCPGCPHPPPDACLGCWRPPALCRAAVVKCCPDCTHTPAQLAAHRPRVHAGPEPSRPRVGCSRTAHGIVGRCLACTGPEGLSQLLAAWETWAAQHAPDLPPAHPVACPVQGCAWDTRGTARGAGPSVCTPGVGPLLPGCQIRRTAGH